MDVLYLNSSKIALIHENVRIVIGASIQEMQAQEKELAQRINDPNIPEEEKNQLRQQRNMLRDGIEMHQLLPSIVPGHGMEKTLQNLENPLQIKNMWDPDTLIHNTTKLIKFLTMKSFNTDQKQMEKSVANLDPNRKNQMLNQLQEYLNILQEIKTAIYKAMDDIKNKYNEVLENCAKNLQEIEYELFSNLEEPLTEESM